MRLSMKPIKLPKNLTEAEERAFWQKIDLTKHFDKSDLRPVVFPKLKSTKKMKYVYDAPSVVSMKPSAIRGRKKREERERKFTPVYQAMKKAMSGLTPCEDFEPMCYECRMREALAMLRHAADLEKKA